MAIISMAQHARPKSSGHQEKLRPQPRSFSRLAGSAMPGMWVSLSPSTAARTSASVAFLSAVIGSSLQCHGVTHSQSSTPFFQA